MKNKHSKICTSCGTKLVEYKFSFNKGMLKFLKELYKAKQPVRTDDLTLTYSERTNSQKLRYWNLAVPHVNASNAAVRGWWVITELGRQFIEGKVKIKKSVVMLQNKVVRYEGADILPVDVVDGFDVYADYVEQIAAQI